MSRKYRSQSGLISWLTETVCPLFVIDQRRRMRFFNQGCVHITGCQPADVIGKPCEYRTDPLATLSERVLNALGPPQEVLNGQELYTRIEFVDAHGQNRQPYVHYQPLRDEAGKWTVVLGVMTEFPLETPRQIQPNSAQAWHLELAQYLRKQVQQYQLSSLISRSAPMRRVAQQILLAQKSQAAVHLQGETGTGKEYVARLIHYHKQKLQSNPLGAPFWVLECRTLPRPDQRRFLKDLHSQRESGEGTVGIYLKHVEALAEDLQVWLAELLSTDQWPPHLRLFSSSERPLIYYVQEGEFEEALAFGLSTLSLALPNLRQRADDLVLLLQYFLEESNRSSEKQMTGWEPQVLQELQTYAWPGNVVELKAVVKEAYQKAPGPLILAEHLPFRFRAGQEAQATLPIEPPRFEPLEKQLEELEKSEILRALTFAKQNKAKAAELLGMTRPRLYRRLEQLGLVGEATGSADE